MCRRSESLLAQCARLADADGARKTPGLTIPGMDQASFLPVPGIALDHDHAVGRSQHVTARSLSARR